MNREVAVTAQTSVWSISSPFRSSTISGPDSSLTYTNSALLTSMELLWSLAVITKISIGPSYFE